MIRNGLHSIAAQCPGECVQHSFESGIDNPRPGSAGIAPVDGSHLFRDCRMSPGVQGRVGAMETADNLQRLPDGELL